MAAAAAAAARRSFYTLNSTSSSTLAVVGVAFSLPNPHCSTSACKASQHLITEGRYDPSFAVLSVSASGSAYAGHSCALGSEFGASLSSRRGRASCRAQVDDGSLGKDAFEVEKALEMVLKNDQSKRIFDNLTDKIFADKESKALLEEFAAAAERVANAKHELELIERQERDLARILAETNDEQVESTASITEKEREVLAAEEEVKAAERALVIARAGYSVQNLTSKWADDDIDEDLERKESGIAAAVSAFAGTVASVPFLLTGNEVGVGSLLSIGGVLASCALFGVTYRYILRRDLGNIQLKLGAAAAFALVRGIGQVDAVQRQVGFPSQGVDEVVLAALEASEGLFAFCFSALALDYCFKRGILSPFPSKKISSS